MRKRTLSMVNGIHWLLLGMISLTSIAVAQSGAGAKGQQGGAPTIFFTDVEAGPVTGGPNNLGVPISIFGKGFGSARGSSQITIGGKEVAAYLVWGANTAHNSQLDMIVVQPGAKVSGGPIVITVDGRSSSSEHTFAARTGTVRYVAPKASDNKNCSSATTCATILNAVSVMKPGDTLLVRGGPYNEGEVWIRSTEGGQPGSPKIIKNYPAEEVYLVNAARPFIVDADFVTVSGLNFQNGKALFAAGWASAQQRGNRFINNTFRGVIDWGAIETVGSDHLLGGNVCEVSGSTTGTMGHCYYVTAGDNVKVLFNIGSGAPGYGLHIYDERRSAQDYRRMIRNTLVEGNILKNSTERSGMIISMTDAGGLGNIIDGIVVRNNIFIGNNHAGLVVTGICRNIRIYNNTFYQNGRVALYIDNAANIESVDVANNLFYQSPNGSCRNNCYTMTEGHTFIGQSAKNVSTRNNFYGPGRAKMTGITDRSPISGAIEFVNPALMNFRVSGSAPVVDRGVRLEPVPKDFDGQSRPQGNAYDIGAFEYSAKAAPQAAASLR